MLAVRKLLLVLTDGKPNDLDHQGIHGTEDSRMAVRAARGLGQTVHGEIADGHWFDRICGRSGIALLPDPPRLGRTLPDIYRALIYETSGEVGIGIAPIHFRHDHHSPASSRPETPR